VALQYVWRYQATSISPRENEVGNYPRGKAIAPRAAKLRGWGMSSTRGVWHRALGGRRRLGARAGLYEAAMRGSIDRSVTMFTGTHSHGQGTRPR